MANPVLKLRDGAIPSIQSKHPWVLATSVQKSIESIPKDSVVDLVDSNQRFVARGLFNADSRIVVRLYAWDEREEIDATLFKTRIQQAVELRRRRLADQQIGPKTARRLVFSEADRLSGLIIDAYGRFVVIQVTSSGVLARLPWVLDAVREQWDCEGISLLIDETTAQREGISQRNEVVFGQFPEGRMTILENGVEFQVDLKQGQKTGHYLDQRTNRRLAAEWIPDGSKVLDVCTYSGGFACTIARFKPSCAITAIDTSQKAIQLAQSNCDLNGLSNVSFEVNDFYKCLESRIESGEKLDAIILDPPRMASARSQVQRALAAYHRLNMLAVRLLNPGGLLVTCSCSGRVSREDFRKMLLGVSKRSGREIQILEQRGGADDHPTSINCLETDYLKCFVCKIY